MEGRIHSVQSLGAVDGPGLRYVIFTQGCPLRCKCCHNPDTWAFGEGEAVSPQELAKRALRFRPYWKNGGGVTVTGGEPLSQPDFVAALFSILRAEGVHTALDTSGAGDLAAARRVLEQTSLVLADLKSPTEEGYREFCGGSLAHTLDFLRLTEEMGIPLWVRHVVIPGVTDSAGSLAAIHRMAHGFSNLEKIEWLPFKTLCLEKYGRMGTPFPLEGTPALGADALQKTLQKLGLWDR